MTYTYLEFATKPLSLLSVTLSHCGPRPNVKPSFAHATKMTSKLTERSYKEPHKWPSNGMLDFEIRVRKVTKVEPALQMEKATWPIGESHVCNARASCYDKVIFTLIEQSYKEPHKWPSNGTLDFEIRSTKMTNNNPAIQWTTPCKLPVNHTSVMQRQDVTTK
jgi:hypothetical protein